MVITNPNVGEALRRTFNQFNRFVVIVWRLGLGKLGNGTEFGGSAMVLVHTGRKTGLRRLSPLNYAVVEGEIYCMAGFGRQCHWYRNMLAHPEVEVWLPEGWWAGIAEEVTDREERVRLIRPVIIGSGFAGRMFGLDAKAMTDEHLDRATRTYRLMRIRRTEARTGPGGPGDLAWVWPLATMALLPLALRGCSIARSRAGGSELNAPLDPGT